MHGHIQEHVAKYFPEEEPVVLEEIVVPEEDEKRVGEEEEEDGKAPRRSIVLYKIVQKFINLIIT